jgi:hypothetical protein
MSNETPDQIVDRYIRTATTERDRLIAEMASTYRQRAEHWEAKAKEEAALCDRLAVLLDQLGVDVVGGRLSSVKIVLDEHTKRREKK